MLPSAQNSNIYATVKNSECHLYLEQCVMLLFSCFDTDIILYFIGFLREVVKEQHLMIIHG